MLTAFIGGLIGAMFYHAVKSIFVPSRKVLPAPVPKEIPVSRMCACGHNSYVHTGNDGLGNCTIFKRLEQGRSITCACQRFTYPEDY